MNITGCRSEDCRGNLHGRFCQQPLGSGQERASPLTDQFPAFEKPHRDFAEISDEAKALRLQQGGLNEARKTEHGGNEKVELEGEELLHDGHAHDEDDGDDHENAARKGAAQGELSAEEKKAIRELQQRDRRVRAHEQAHVAASGRIAVSGPSYEYEQGPDGRNYAVGGSVNYSVPPASTPEEERQLAQQLRRMALAPADPSPTDRSTAARAAAKEARANRDIQAERMEERTQSGQDTEEAAFVATGAGLEDAQDGGNKINRKPQSPGTESEINSKKQTGMGSGMGVDMGVGTGSSTGSNMGVDMGGQNRGGGATPLTGTIKAFGGARDMVAANLVAAYADNSGAGRQTSLFSAMA